jgi:hypothetical protein
MDEQLWADIYLVLESMEGDCGALLNKIGQLTDSKDSRAVWVRVGELCDALEAALEIAKLA